MKIVISVILVAILLMLLAVAAHCLWVQQQMQEMYIDYMRYNLYRHRMNLAREREGEVESEAEE